MGRALATGMRDPRLLSRAADVFGTADQAAWPVVVSATHEPGGRRRRRGEFDCGGDRCAAWLYRPAETRDPVPAVVLAPGLAGVRAAAVDGFAAHSAAAGIAALVFDYRGFGDSGGSPRQLMTVRRHRGLARRRRGHPRVARRRPCAGCAVGGSITGGHVLVSPPRPLDRGGRLARAPGRRAELHGGGPALPPPQCGCSWPGFATSRAPAYRRSPAYVPVIGPPGSLAVLTSPDAEPDYRAILPEGWDDWIAARAALSLLAYRPGLAARRVRCPVLLTLASRDAVTPPRRAERLVRRAPHVEVASYAVGHFESFAAPAADRMLSDATDFLHRHLNRRDEDRPWE